MGALGGVIALAAAGYYNGVLVSGLPLLVILLVLLDFLHRGRLFEPRPLYGRKLRREPRRAILGTGPDGEWCRQDHRALEPGADRGHEPSRLAATKTEAAVLPAFLFLAFCMLLVGLSFLILGVETHGKTMALAPDEQSPAQPRSTRAAT